MNSNRVVPYLARVNSCEGTRQKPELLYVTRGGKKNSLIFHTKENGKFFQYRQKSVNKKSIVLMCIYYCTLCTRKIQDPTIVVLTF